jgi:hypothetical protein
MLVFLVSISIYDYRPSAYTSTIMRWIEVAFQVALFRLPR